MKTITARIPDALAYEIDAAATQLKRSRAQVVRRALEYYLDDRADLRLDLKRIQDPDDPILNWGDSRRGVYGRMEQTTEIVGSLLESLPEGDWGVLR